MHIFIGPKKPIYMGQNEAGKVNQFKSLGSTKARDADSAIPITDRNDIAKKWVINFTKTWRDKAIVTKFKLRGLSGLDQDDIQSWRLDPQKKRYIKKINSAEMWFCR